MKYAVSACLLGQNCKYNGGNNRHEALLKALEGCEVISLCPEVAGGLPTPRVPVELQNGLAVNRDGENVHSQFSAGVSRCLKQLEGQGNVSIILQPRSPSCGKGLIYDGSFTGKLIEGNGLLVQALIDKGYTVMTPDEFLGKKE